MKNWLFFVSIALNLALVDGALADTTDSRKSPIGRRIANFSARDCFGKERTLDEFKQSKLVVVAFLGTECPLAKLYGPRLETLRKRFGDQGVTLLGINSNSQDSITELAAYRQRHGIAFPLLKDLGNKVADAFGAVRTPEVFVLDQERKIRYWGRIDDQYTIGIQREKPKKQDLAIALTELLSGKKVSVPLTEAVGCHIGRVQTINRMATLPTRSTSRRSSIDVVLNAIATRRSLLFRWLAMPTSKAGGRQLPR